jgi:hypothetical protein
MVTFRKDTCMRSMVQTVVSAIFVVLASHNLLNAQAVTPRGIETNSGPIIPFLEGTDVFVSIEKTPDGWRRDTVFEGDIFPHLVVYQNFTDVIDAGRQSARGEPRRIAWVISGTPAVRIRMFEEISNPVRTPSYMPRGNVQMILARGIREALAAGGEKRNRVTLWEGHAIIGHHSNGQDGCLYQDEVRNGELCEVDPTSTAGHVINTHDGSFSTNYARIGVNFRRNYLDDDLWANREWGLRADVEQHFRMDPLIRDLYGRTRFELAASYANRETRMCRRRLDVSGSAKAIVGADAEVWPVAITAQVSCFPFSRGGWGFFARYYGGQDYYNIGFLENVQRFQVGATFNQGGFFRFQRPATPAKP